MAGSWSHINRVRIDLAVVSVWGGDWEPQRPLQLVSGAPICGIYARGVKLQSYMWQLSCDVNRQLWGDLKSWEAVKARVWVNRILTR